MKDFLFYCSSGIGLLIVFSIFLFLILGCCHTHEEVPVVRDPVEYKISWWTEQT